MCKVQSMAKFHNLEMVVNTLSDGGVELNITVRKSWSVIAIPIQSMAKFLNLEMVVNTLSDSGVEMTYHGKPVVISRLVEFINFCSRIQMVLNKHKNYADIEVKGAAIRKQDGWVNYLTKVTAMHSNSYSGEDYEELISNENFIVYRSHLKLEDIFERALASGLITQKHDIKQCIQKGVYKTAILSSQEAEQFGVKWSSSLYEIWCREEDVPTKPDITPERKSKNYENAHDAIKDLIGIDLDKNDERIGNVLIFLPDYRARLVESNLHTIEYHSSLINANDLALVRETIEFEDVLWRDAINLSELEKAPSEDGSRICLVDLDSSAIVEYAVPPEYRVCEPSDDIAQLFDKCTTELIDRRETPWILSLLVDSQTVSGNSRTTDRMRMESSKQWDKRTKGKQKPRYIDSTFIRSDENELKKALKDISSGIYEYVKIMDPYLPPEWVDFVATLPDNVDINIITSQTDEQEIIQKFKNLHRINRVEIIKIYDNNGGPRGTPLHDRYILTNGMGWQIGTSLDSASKKYTNIIQLPNNWNIEESFDFLWNEDNDIPNSHGGICTRAKIYP
jgi:hypothetical protein